MVCKGSDSRRQAVGQGTATSFGRFPRTAGAACGKTVPRTPVEQPYSYEHYIPAIPPEQRLSAILNRRAEFFEPFPNYDAIAHDEQVTNCHDFG
jgi:hypothetical protein